MWSILNIIGGYRWKILLAGIFKNISFQHDIVYVS